MFVKEDDLVEEENTVAALKRSADGETLTKQQRMQHHIDVYTKTQVRPKLAVRMNPTSRSIGRVRRRAQKVERSLRARC